jgi:hypothetical protein
MPAGSVNAPRAHVAQPNDDLRQFSAARHIERGVLKAPPWERNKAERMMVRVTAEKRHQSRDGIGHAHPKHLDEKVPLFCEIAGIKDQMVEAQGLARRTRIGAIGGLHIGYQFDGVTLGIAEPQKPSEPGLHLAIRPQINPNAIFAENLRGSIKFSIIDDFERNVMKASAIAHQFEHVMMVVGCAEVQVPCLPVHDLQPATIDVKISLAVQITRA